MKGCHHGGKKTRDVTKDSEIQLDLLPQEEAVGKEGREVGAQPGDRRTHLCDATFPPDTISVGKDGASGKSASSRSFVSD